MERYPKESRKTSHKVLNDFYNTCNSLSTNIRTIKNNNNKHQKDNPIEIG